MSAEKLLRDLLQPKLSGMWDHFDTIGIYLYHDRWSHKLQVDMGGDHSRKWVIRVYPGVKDLKINPSIRNYEQDPRIAMVLRDLEKANPEYLSFILKDGKGRSLGRVGSVLGSMLKRKMKTRHEKEEREYVRREFEVEVLKDVSDLVFYHATLHSRLKSIQSKGLLPGGPGSSVRGWTDITNFSLQEAVYLTTSEDYAWAIAETLVANHWEDAVVLRIDGRALQEYDHLMVDEDVLPQDPFTGLRAPLTQMGGLLPGYARSLVDDIESLGYAAPIPPRYISVEGVFETPEGMGRTASTAAIKEWIDSWGDPITLYREVYVKPGKEPDLQNLGRYWTPIRKKAHSPYGSLDNPGWEPVVLVAKLKREHVDEFETIATLRRYGAGEAEIRPLPGAPLEVQGYYREGRFYPMGGRGKAGFHFVLEKTMRKASPRKVVDLYMAQKGASPMRVVARYLLAEYKDQIPGGLADKGPPKGLDIDELTMGIKVEMEHTDDPYVAMEIALDHLTEMSDYYTKLKKVEKGT